MKSIKTLFLFAAASMAMSSCLSDDDGEEKVTFAYSNNFSYVVDTSVNTTQGELFEGAVYTIELDMSKGTAGVTVSNLTLSSSGSRLSFSLRDQDYKVSNGMTIIDVPEYVTTINGSTHTISDFTLSYLPRIVSGGIDASYYNVVFVVDNRYVVRAIQKASLMYGETVMTDLGTNGSGTLTNPTPFVGYDLDYTKGTATYYIYNIQYDGNLYSTIRLDGIPFTVDASGVTLSSDEEITPVMTGDAESNKVKDFRSVCTFEPEMTLNMVIADKYSIDGKYNLTGEFK